MAELTEGEILRQLKADDLIGSTEGVYSDLITKAGNELADQFKDYIRKNSKNPNTQAGVVAIPLTKGFAIEADFYYDFIDKGVRGAPLPQGIKPISGTVTQGVYQFKNLKTSREMFENIRGIVGGSKSRVWGAMINIKKRGIKAKNITDNVLTDEVIEQIAEDLGKVTGLALTASVTKHGKPSN